VKTPLPSVWSAAELLAQHRAAVAACSQLVQVSRLALSEHDVLSQGWFDRIRESQEVLLLSVPRDVVGEPLGG
jgi:hypothetical protein